jgi:DNA polymerase-3 subunit epsilon
MNHPFGFKIERPLCVLDIETTGTDLAVDRIVSLFARKHLNECETFYFSQLFNPGIQMSDEVIAVHGITNAAVAEKPPFKPAHARFLAEMLSDCDLVGYNILGFDLPILYEECARVGVELKVDEKRVIDPMGIFRLNEPHTLSHAMKFYCGLEHTGAHQAESDADSTLLVLAGQIARYPELQGLGVEALAAKSRTKDALDWAGKIVRNKEGVAVYSFGKNRGKPVTQDVGYARWVLEGNFPKQTKDVLRGLLPGGDRA